MKYLRICRIDKIILIISVFQIFLFCVQFPPSSFITISSSNPSEQPDSINAPVEWTIMIYMAADNNLETAGVEDLVELRVANIDNTSISVVIEFDGWESCGPQPEDNAIYAGSTRYYVPGNNQPLQVLNSSEKNMGDPNNLRDFIDFSTTNYPANYYCLILWNHGLAWETGETSWQDFLAAPSSRSEYTDQLNSNNLGRKNICWDDRSFGDSLSDAELRTALQGYYFDIIAFDACLMGCIETAYGIKDHAAYMVSSEESIGLSGFYYTGILETLQSAMNLVQDTSPAAFGTIIAQESYNRQYSTGEIGEMCEIAVINLTQISQVITQIENLVPYVTGMSYYERQTLCSNTESIAEFDMPEQIDLTALANLIVGIDASASTVVNNLISAINNIVVWENHIVEYWSSSTGLTIFFPWREGLSVSNYVQVTRFGAETTWPQVVSSISSSVVPFDQIDLSDLSPTKPTASGYLYEGDSYFYWVWLYRNEQVSFRLTADGGTDFDLYCYDIDLELVAESIETTYPELVSIGSNEGTWAILEVYSYAGAGSYDLTSTFTSSAAELDVLGCIGMFPLYSADGINEMRAVLFFDCPAQTVTFTLSVLGGSIPFELQWDQTFIRGYQKAIISIPCDYLYHFMSGEDTSYPYSKSYWDCFGYLSVSASNGGSFTYTDPIHLAYLVKLEDLDPNLDQLVDPMESYPLILVDPIGGDPRIETTTTEPPDISPTSHGNPNSFDPNFLNDLIPVFYGVGGLVTIGLVVWRKLSLRKAASKNLGTSQTRFQYQPPRATPQPRVKVPQAPFIFCGNCGNMALRTGDNVYTCTKCGKQYRFV